MDNQNKNCQLFLMQIHKKQIPNHFFLKYILNLLEELLPYSLIKKLLLNKIFQNIYFLKQMHNEGMTILLNTINKTGELSLT